MGPILSDYLWINIMKSKNKMFTVELQGLDLDDISFEEVDAVKTLKYRTTTGMDGNNEW